MIQTITDGRPEHRVIHALDCDCGACKLATAIFGQHPAQLRLDAIQAVHDRLGERAARDYANDHPVECYAVTNDSGDLFGLFQTRKQAQTAFPALV